MNKTIVGLLFLMLCLTGATEAGASVTINEFLADPPPGILGDANRDGVRDSSQDEFIELLNTGNRNQDISLWSLWDSSELRHEFPALTLLAPWENIVIFGGGPIPLFDSVCTASTGTLSLNNSGDWIVLKNSFGEIVEKIIYGSDANRDQSLTRYPLESGLFRLHTAVSASALPFSPGKDFAGQSFKSPLVTPEPSSGLLFGFGLLLLRRFRMGRMKKSGA